MSNYGTYIAGNSEMVDGVNTNLIVISLAVNEEGNSDVRITEDNQFVEGFYDLTDEDSVEIFHRIQKENFGYIDTKITVDDLKKLRK